MGGDRLMFKMLISGERYGQGQRNPKATQSGAQHS